MPFSVKTKLQIYKCFLTEDENWRDRDYDRSTYNNNYRTTRGRGSGYRGRGRGRGGTSRGGGYRQRPDFLGYSNDYVQVSSHKC